MKGKVLVTKSPFFLAFLILALLANIRVCIASEFDASLLRNLKAGKYEIVDSNVFVNKNDPISQFCANFTLGDTEIKKFFNSARQITMQKFHYDDRYLTAPCSVKGHLIHLDHKYEFNIMASGVAYISSEKNGIIVECVSRCQRLLTPTPSSPRALNNLPDDVTQFITRRGLCDHLRGEVPDAPDADFIKRINEACSGTDGQLEGLKQKYRSNSVVTSKLSAFEPNVEGK